MITNSRFYKESDGRWYIDLPEYPGEKDDLEMVCGADMMLELLSEGEASVQLTYANEPFKEYIFELEKTAEDELGASYLALHPQFYPFEVWLCPVTKFVFKEYPQIIYIR